KRLARDRWPAPVVDYPRVGRRATLNDARARQGGSNMTAVGSLNRSFASSNRADETSGVLYVPRVQPLDGALGALSFFTRLLKNPLRILPAAAYEEGIVWAERAGRLVCWITD